jgi:hypothetical protein
MLSKPFKLESCGSQVTTWPEKQRKQRMFLPSGSNELPKNARHAILISMKAMKALKSTVKGELIRWSYERRVLRNPDRIIIVVAISRAVNIIDFWFFTQLLRAP